MRIQRQPRLETEGKTQAFLAAGQHIPAQSQLGSGSEMELWAPRALT